MLIAGSGRGLAAVEGRNNESTTERPCFVGATAGGGAIPMQTILPSTRLALVFRHWLALVGIEAHGLFMDGSWIVHGWLMENSLVGIGLHRRARRADGKVDCLIMYLPPAIAPTYHCLSVVLSLFCRGVDAFFPRWARLFKQASRHPTRHGAGEALMMDHVLLMDCSWTVQG